MSMNGPLARAARALIQWPRSHVAKIAELDEETLARFEAGGSVLAASELTRLRDALERGGAVGLTRLGDPGSMLVHGWL